jgi:hypothetical protein
MTKVLVLIAIVFSPVLQTQVKQTNDPRVEPGTAIKEAIRLLEARDYVGFVKTCIRPSELTEMTTKYGTVEEAAKAFANTDRPAKLLDILKAASALTPAINADGTRADYRFDKPVAGANRLSLAKIDGYWYLRD